VAIRFFSRIREILRRYFVAGVLAFAPIGITIWALAWIVERLDNLILPRLIHLFFPAIQDPPRIPLLGAAFTLLVILLFGVIARHFFGLELVRLGERILTRVPIARSIYGGVKQLVEAILKSGEGTSFRRVAIIEYPRQGLYALAFVTGPARGVVQAAHETPLVNCFVPTTPNPTSGFYLLIPRDDLIEIDMSVEDAFKLVMSAGLVYPGEGEPTTAPAPGTPSAESTAQTPA
jgi:uncharacterized membrane protein